MTNEKIEQAMATEILIAEEAAKIREDVLGDADKLLPQAFMKLWPLLCRQIPAGFIQHVPRLEKGKPYASTGVRSVQVLIDRMNNVLTPLFWWDEVEYEQGGKLCHVTVNVGNRDQWVAIYGMEEPQRSGVLASGSSWGGVDRGSTTGNVYKGSYTNAAKRAFAQVGPGHEIYLGTVDLDPDVSTEMAEEARPSGGRDLAAALYKRAVDLGLTDRLQLAASHVAGRDVGECKTKAKATTALAGLSVHEMERLDNWLSQKADQAAGS